MPALVPTEFYGEIVWLGVSPNPEGEGSLRSVGRDALELGFDGPGGEIRHAGRTRLSCSRVLSQHERGTEIANVRQLSIVSQEELDEIAQECGLDTINPEWVGATVVLKGLPDFTHVPPSSRLQVPNGTTIVIDMENRPCILPGREIEKEHPEVGAKFKPAARDRRGVTAWVERPGVLELGQKVRLHIPEQRSWQPS